MVLSHSSGAPTHFKALFCAWYFVHGVLCMSRTDFGCIRVQIEHSFDWITVHDGTRCVNSVRLQMHANGLGYWLQYQCCWHVTGQQHANVMQCIIQAQMLPNFLSVVMLTGQAMRQLCRDSLMTFVTT